MYSIRFTVFIHNLSFRPLTFGFVVGFLSAYSPSVQRIDTFSLPSSLRNRNKPRGQNTTRCKTERSNFITTHARSSAPFHFLHQFVKIHVIKQHKINSTFIRDGSRGS